MLDTLLGQILHNIRLQIKGKHSCLRQECSCEALWYWAAPGLTQGSCYKPPLGIPPVVLTCISIAVSYNTMGVCAADLNAVDTDPGRYKGQDARHQIYELNGLVVLIQTLLPKLIQPCTPDDKSRVHLQDTSNMSMFRQVAQLECM